MTKTKKRILWAAIWIICGVYNWGTTMAVCSDIEHELNTKGRPPYGISAFMTVFGPAGTLVMAPLSNFNEHGWRIK